MYISAVISEFNPFHLGHKYFIDRIRQNGTTHVIAVMSGNFVQRGEPAILSKWARTEFILNCGVDLVIEIPVSKSISTAEKYAYNGVKIVDAIGCVDSLCFGSECGNMDLLLELSKILSDDNIISYIKKFLKQGITYAKAREMAVKLLMGEKFELLIRQPNNILAVEYIKAVNKIGCGVCLNTIMRNGAGHDSKGSSDDGIISALEIRDLMRSKKQVDRFVPKVCMDIIEREISLKRAPSDLIYTERAILSKLRSMDIETLSKLPDISEGIEYRILNAVKTAGSLEELYFKIKTKRYTMSRIKRIILSAFLDINKDCQSMDVPYIRVLGFNDKGAEVLKQMKHKAKLPVVTNFCDVKKLNRECVYTFETESKASDLYSLMLPKVMDCGRDKTSKIIVIK